jgi:iron uptake system component EfeO
VRRAPSKITGEEDRYSHTDLWDFEANVDGSFAAFRSLRPLVEGSDPALAGEIASRFAAVDRALDRYRRGRGFVLYTQLTKSDVRSLANLVDALAEPLSTLGARVVTAGS